MVTAAKKVGHEQHLLLLEKDTSVHACVSTQAGAEDEYIFQKCVIAQQSEYL